MEWNPLSLEGLEEGQFLEDAQERLELARRTLMRFAAQHGLKAKGAKAKITMSIELEHTDPENRTYSVKTSIKTSLPDRPSRSMPAAYDEDHTGRPTLIVQGGRLPRDLPQQGEMFTGPTFRDPTASPHPTPNRPGPLEAPRDFQDDIDPNIKPGGE